MEGERGEGGVFYTCSSFFSRVGHGGGDGTSGILCSCLIGEKKIESVKLKSPSDFSCSKFSSSFLFILL